MSDTIRLVDGSSYLEGRVEVLSNGEWGTVCDNEWDLNDAHVVCRFLGYGDVLRATSGGMFGEGSGSVVLSGVRCVGTEEDLFSCWHNGFETNACDHSHDAGVICSGKLRILWRS